MKLSDAQRRALWNYRNGHWWAAYEQQATGSTMSALYVRGLVERRAGGKPGYEYRITPAGRKELEVNYDRLR